jgi:hypothetical protein
MTSRPSTATEYNDLVVEDSRKDGQTNTDWLNTTIDGDAVGVLVLIGGCGLTDFRLRVAQSQVRRDLLPSHWSHVAIIRDKVETSKDYKLYEISLEPRKGFGIVPKNNAVQEGLSSAYDDINQYPNIAWLRFPVSSEVLKAEVPLADSGKKKTARKRQMAPAVIARPLGQAIDANIEEFRKRRGIIDMSAMITDWLGFAWGVPDRGNPIVRNVGVPSAVFVESIYGMLGIELTPGIATQGSCPEAIWQAARWWQDFYKSPASLTMGAPYGKYVLGQREAWARG